MHTGSRAAHHQGECDEDKTLGTEVLRLDVPRASREKLLHAVKALREIGVDPDDPQALIEAADRLHDAYEYQQMVIHLRPRELEPTGVDR